MRNIKRTEVSENHRMLVEFESGERKIFDIKPYSLIPVLAVLKNEVAFQRVVNHGYFIEWPDCNVDLSADTLLHDGK